MKTPEEMAEEYRDRLMQNGERPNVFDIFLAGYEAAMDNFPEKPDGSNSSNNSNGWISVKEVIINGKTYRLVEP